MTSSSPSAIVHLDSDGIVTYGDVKLVGLMAVESVIPLLMSVMVAKQDMK
jgi:hypothetical protein